MLTENDIKEELSYAYIHAIASRAELTCEIVRKDRDSIDLHIRARGRLHPESTLMSPQLAVQLKASVIDPLPDGAFDFRLTRKNYDDLRQRSMVPRVLVVFAMPRDPARWLSLSEDELVLRRCAYWCSLFGLPDSPNEKYQEVRLDRKNAFTGEVLRDLMLKASREEEISHGT
ncbi:MAG: DUF4365 domain-containing protein [Minicystis sp.]